MSFDPMCISNPKPIFINLIDYGVDFAFAVSSAISGTPYKGSISNAAQLFELCKNQKRIKIGVLESAAVDFSMYKLQVPMSALCLKDYRCITLALRTSCFVNGYQIFVDITITADGDCCYYGSSYNYTTS